MYAVYTTFILYLTLPITVEACSSRATVLITKNNKDIFTVYGGRETASR